MSVGHGVHIIPGLRGATRTHRRYNHLGVGSCGLDHPGHEGSVVSVAIHRKPSGLSRMPADARIIARPRNDVRLWDLTLTGPPTHRRCTVRRCTGYPVAAAIYSRTRRSGR